MTARPLTPLRALSLVLGSIDALRNLRALWLLLATFAAAGLALAIAEAALGHADAPRAALLAASALAIAFYGANATGLMLMDDLLGRPQRGPLDALRDAALPVARLAGVLLVVVAAAAAIVAAVLALLWLARLPLLGPIAFGAIVPIAVLALGLLVLVLVALVGALAGPATWAGLGVRDTLRLLLAQAPRLLPIVLLGGAVGALSAAVGAIATFVVVAGGRLVAALAVIGAGIEVPPAVLMAGLFGRGLRTLGAAGVEATVTPHGAAALIGGGIVFALALVTPGLVYLRGVAALFLAVTGERGVRR